MFGNLFKQKKTKIEEQREQYQLQLAKITTHYNGVRINETLVGKIQAARMDECIPEKQTKIAVERSVERPMTFGDDVFGWLNHVRDEAKALMNKNHRYDKEEKEYLERIKKESQQKSIEQSRKFFVEYGVLPKQMA